MEVRVIQAANDGDREVHASTEVIDLPVVTSKTVRQYLINRFEIDEEEGADIDEMFVILKKGPAVVAIGQEDFLFFVFYEEK